MDTRWARLLRGWSTAAVSVFVAAVSHVAGGGALPGVLAAVLALTVAGLVSMALTGRSLSRVRLAIAVSASQFAFHLLFGLGATPAMSAMAPMESAAGALHQHGAMLMPAAVAPAASGSMPQHSTMWLAHLAAALLTFVLLRRGEAAFWGLVELARTALVAVLLPVSDRIRPISAEPSRLRFALADRRTPRDLVVVLAGRSLRGPPLPQR